ncbi:MAG: methyltransferase domain-containing protein [Pseudonocardiaceae bacterium]|nr:methyltransferase domain-containing protein [Pseudonocardiaceae bacterium]
MHIAVRDRPGGRDTGVSVRRVRSTWEELGRSDPFWAVLTHPDRRGGRWEHDEFFALGRQDVAEYIAMLAERELFLGDRVLDFGCGVGRLTNALAEHTREVIGVDIAGSMIEQATELNQHPERVTFMHYDGRVLPFPDAGFDSAVSLLVLQHSTPETQLANLLELRRVVRPGGMIMVQIPSRRRHPAPLPTEAGHVQLEPLAVPERLGRGQHAEIRVRITNRGAHTWRAEHRIRLGNHWLAGDRVLIQDDGRSDLPHTFRPGQDAELTLPITAPGRAGDYQLELDLVQETVSWFADLGSRPARLPVRVEHAEHVSDGEHTAHVEPDLAPAPEPDLPEVSPEFDDAGIEMHGLEVSLVRALFNHCGCHIVDVVEDSLAGEEWESYTYFVRHGPS